MGDPVRCALTSTPSMAPSCVDVTWPVSARLDESNNRSAKVTFAESSVPSKAPGKILAKALRGMPRVPIAAARQLALRLDHQAIDFNGSRRIATRRLSPHRPLQLEAVLAAGNLHVLRIDVLAEARKLEMTLLICARHEACVAVLDFGADLGISHAAAAIQILGESEKRNARIRLIFVVFVQRGATGPCHSGNGQRKH